VKRVALVTALALAGSGCGHNKQLTNRQVALGVVGAAAVVGLIILLSLQCNELTETCD
jgi:hypothetical protein